MKHIRVLDKYTADRIAAGEVVERPASVVKELVENALDAGTRTITIETLEGGLGLIRVTDDGCGIPAGEVQTAFLRHATSKIEDSDDLARIETLGFRGEALSSIAAVARVEMRTKTADAQAGAQIRVEGGDVLSFAETGVPDGTGVEVADLFYNVPARLKFVKNARAEAAYVGDYISRMIMARPDVAFRLVQSGRSVYKSAGDGDFLNAVYCVYGAEVMPHLKNIAYDDGYIALSGCVGTEQIGRANRTAQSFFINGRYIKSQKLSFALQRAYDARLMTGRFPFCAVSIRINSQEIDVNVHPNKLDVRFRQEERVVRALLHAARNALSEGSAAKAFVEAPLLEQRDERPFSAGRTNTCGSKPCRPTRSPRSRRKGSCSTTPARFPRRSNSTPRRRPLMCRPRWSGSSRRSLGCGISKSSGRYSTATGSRSSTRGYSSSTSTRRTREGSTNRY